MKEIIDKYLNYSMGDHYSDRLSDTEYEIDDYDYHVNLNIDAKHNNEEILVIGVLTENLVKLFVNEYSSIDEDIKYYRKNEIEFYKEEDAIKYKKNVEDRINYYDEEGLLRSNRICLFLSFDKMIMSLLSFVITLASFPIHVSISFANERIRLLVFTPIFPVMAIDAATEK